MLKRLEEERAELREKPIAELEKEINERVYRLYGLDEQNKKVVEEFLRKFWHFLKPKAWRCKIFIC